MQDQTAVRHLAVIGGLGHLAGADLHAKLSATIRAQAHGAAAQYRLTLDRHPYLRGLDADIERISSRKLYLYDTTAALAGSHAACVLLPCFVSHTFLDELQAEVAVPVIDMMQALAAHLAPHGGRLGVLCTSYVQQQKLFERYLDAQRLLYPSQAVQERHIAPAIYGATGILAGFADEGVLDRLARACEALLADGADTIVPGCSEIAVLAGALRARGLPVVDSHQVYAEHALAHQQQAGHAAGPAPIFRLGIIGGIGPAATVDFMQKIIDGTRAQRDQDHIRLVVDHNPQIPDRTANLVGQGADPTLALYSACRRLQAQGAALIAMPCNTAHAYVPRLQPGLSVPIVNMLAETVAHIGSRLPEHRVIGLLATTGTVSSGVYAQAALGAGFELLTPDASCQSLVMDAIYGPCGVKAGFVDGACKDALLQALAHLVQRGATAVILGCTELPLVLPEHAAFEVDGKPVVLLDPTAILARRCVALAGAANASGVADVFDNALS